jgi:hypothetical protein
MNKRLVVLILLGLGVFTAGLAWAGASPETGGSHLSGGLLPYFANPLIQLAALGAFVTYVFSPGSQKRKNGRIELDQIVLDELLAGGRSTFRGIVTLAVFVIVGALVAMIVGEPTSDRSAVMIGMGWTGLIVAGKGLTSKVSGG